MDFDILIVEDEKVVNESAVKILSSEGFTVDSAFEGETAVKKIENNKYKLIITDLMLPEISGIKVIELIKIKYPHIPVIMITGYATLTSVFESFKIGAFDFVPKPFTYEELLGVVFRAIDYSEKINITEDDNDFFGNNNNLQSLYLVGDHSWVYFEDKATAIIGLGKSFMHFIDRIIDIEFPDMDEELMQGGVCAQLICRQKFLHRIWTPVSGSILENNEEIKNTLDSTKSENVLGGWISRIKPTNLDKELVYLSPYIKH